MTSTQARPRSGRRPGASGTRAAIAAAARVQFGDVGFDRTTIRSVAAAAGVDPALVMHFYCSKQQLFVETMALPFDPAPVVADLLAGERETIGIRLAHFLLHAMEDPAVSTVLLGRIRAAASDPEAARLLRDLVPGELVGPLTRELGVDQPELRAGLVSSQLIGFAVARWIVGVEALAALDVERSIAFLGPSLQRFLAGPLP